MCLFVFLFRGWSHVTITHDALDLTTQAPFFRPSPPPCTGTSWSCLRLYIVTPSDPSPVPVTSDGEDVRPVQTCSCDDHLVLTSGDWILKHVQWANRWHESHCNALFFLPLTSRKHLYNFRCKCEIYVFNNPPFSELKISVSVAESLNKNPFRTNSANVSAKRTISHLP